MKKLTAKSKNLEIVIEITYKGLTKEIIDNPGNALNKRLDAVLVGLRSELTMFLLELEKEIDFRR